MSTILCTGKLADLNQAERDVIELLLTGISYKEAGLKLGVCERTVRRHRKSALKTLGYRTVVEAAAKLSAYRQPLRPLRPAEVAFHTASIGMSVVDTSGRWIAVNHALCRALGYYESELIGREPASVVERGDERIMRNQLRTLTQGLIPSYSAVRRCIRRDGSRVSCRVRLRLIRRSDGQPFGAFGEAEFLEPCPNWDID